MSLKEIKKWGRITTGTCVVLLLVSGFLPAGTLKNAVLLLAFVGMVGAWRCSQKMICPHCGRKVRMSTEKCPFCGKNVLEETKESETEA